MRKRATMEFTVGFSDALDRRPAEYYPATVPGAVQLDWAKAKNRPPYWEGNNYREYAFAEDCYWQYRTEITVEDLPDTVAWLCFTSIDYEFDVKIDGVTVYHQEGMFTPVRINLSDYAGRRCLVEVVVYPAPKREGAEKGTSAEASASCKPAVGYGWDWHPRLIPLGICDEAYVEYTPRTHIAAFSVTSRVEESLETAAITVTASIAHPAGEAVLTVTVPDGSPVATETRPAAETLSFTVPIANPQLWWCAGQGEPHLYTVTLRVLSDHAVSDAAVRRTGLRRVRLLPNEGAWDVQAFPSTQATHPITLELNGRRIFARGSNWVPPEIFPGIIDEETYRTALTLARDAHMNLLRCWGGAIVNKDSFFDLCDELGLMVWQEFPLACNCYPDDPHYLHILDQESRSILLRLRHHPCIVLWCGGNELFCSWSRMTNQSLPLRLLDKNCFELQPEVPFLMTSPLYGMGHGGYTLTYGGEEMITSFIHAGKTAYTEFGCPGPSTRTMLESFMTEEELADFGSEVWFTHHARKAWGADETWLGISDIRRFYGEELSFDQVLEAGLQLQAEGYKHLFEESRRQWPRCSMALNWCYNEPWPTAANNNLIGWKNVPKPAYYAVKESLRPVMLSLRFEKLIWSPEETASIDVFVLNDSPQPLAGGRMSVHALTGETDLLLGEFTYGEVAGNANALIGTVEFSFAGAAANLVAFEARSSDRPSMDSRYILSSGLHKTTAGVQSWLFSEAPLFSETPLVLLRS